MANTYSSSTYTSGSEYVPGDLKVDGAATTGSLTTGTLATGAVTGSASIAGTFFSLTAGVTPGSPTEGMIFAKASDHHLYFYNGSAWVQLDN